ncbi:hypothetical protein PAXINDRAFT_170544 [Paxillus involutus ATCC 200175]|uniref:Uncharacterized protein n=1 Tax=Paxillus involutus ATCC 200175 TaxID=664439 RepID=A0A0C9U0J0_PAXIN|nr:hypothetical protein PAXINDRAFT_170544 [Paxillus involutus ATCC 200175]
MVSNHLSHIRGNIKTCLGESLEKRKNIMDTVLSVVGTKSGVGMEIGSSNWMRFAFLRRCYRIFQIGLARDRSTVEKCFSVYLLPSMEKDLCEHVSFHLDKSLDDLMEQLAEKLDTMVQVDMDEPAEQNQENSSTPNNNGNTTSSQVNGEDDPDADGIPDEEYTPGERPASDNETTREKKDDEVSGFFSEEDGSAPVYTSSKFWNYADDSLAKMHRKAVKEGTTQERAEKFYAQTLSEILMMDLHEYPGRRRISEKPATDADRPEWQKTIEKELVW